MVAAPSGVSTSARLEVTEAEHDVLVAVGLFLGQRRCEDWVSLVARRRSGEDFGRQRRREALTAGSTSRWADAVTMSNDRQFRLAMDNLYRERRDKRAALAKVEARLAAPIGGRDGRVRGYKSKAEHAGKVQRRDHLQAKLAALQRGIDERSPSVQFGGRDLARERVGLDTDEDLAAWRVRRLAARMFIEAPGDRNKLLGNQTIRVDPASGLLTLRLPNDLAHLSNTPGAVPTFVFASPVRFHHLGAEWAAQTACGAVAYAVAFDCDTQKWQVTASWTLPVASETPELESLQHSRSLGVDVNAGHFACCVTDEHGNPCGEPFTVPFPTEGPESLRDAHLRHALTTVIKFAVAEGCETLDMEYLDFADSRSTGRETMGSGAKGKAFRRAVSNIPHAKIARQTASMARRAGLAVIASDPAYTSKWGAEHWLAPIRQTRKGAAATGHHAAGCVISRRSHGYKARRKAGAAAADQRNRSGEHSPSRPSRVPAAGGAISPAAGPCDPGHRTRLGATAPGTTRGQTVVPEPSLRPLSRDRHGSARPGGRHQPQTRRNHGIKQTP